MNIIFRTKFEKSLTNDAMRQEYLNAFAKFINLNEDDAFDMLWKMTYAPSSEVFAAIDLQSAPFEMYSAIRNELRFQYEQWHSNAFDAKVSETCRIVFNILANHTDPITAKVVYDHCIMHAYKVKNELERILFLLNNSNENYSFGGIRAIGFSSAEAKYLLPYHDWIHSLFKAKIEELNPNNVTNLNLIQNIEDVLDEDTEPITEKVIPEDTEIFTETLLTFKALSPENILKDLEHFSFFAIKNNMEALLSIQNLGYDLNKVIAQKDEIATFIKAALIFKN